MNLDFSTENLLTDPIRIFRIYSALKAHFKGEYTIRKGLNSCKRFKCSQKTFHKRKDISLFYRLATELTEENAYTFFISQFIENSDLYSFEIVREMFIARSIWSEWKLRMKKCEKNFIEDCIWLLSHYGSWKELIKDRNYDYPLLFSFILNRNINPETFSWLIYILKIGNSELYPSLVQPEIFSCISKKFLQYRILLEPLCGISLKNIKGILKEITERTSLRA